MDYDLAVIGSGAGGSTAAVMAAKAGKTVALIEQNRFGGDAANFTDVPMAALQTATHLLELAQDGAKLGLTTASLRYNYGNLMRWKDEAKKHAGIGNNRRFYEKLGIKTIPGQATFLDQHELAIGEKTTLTAKKILIASGAEYKSEVGLSGIKNIENVPHLTPDTALNLRQPPKTLLIIGGGATGVELAQYFALLGTKVLIAEISDRLLPREDEEVGQLVDQLFNINYAIKVLVGTRVISASTSALGNQITFVRDGQTKRIKVDNILVATGKAPAIDIGLENAKIKHDDDGIIVNEFLQTSVKHIYASGDVLGGDSSTSKAVYQSQVAGSNLLGKNHAAVDYSGTPRITNLIPQIASVGLSEDDALKSDLKVQKSFVPLSQTAASNSTGFHNGFVKLIADKKTGQLLGGTIAAPEAASLVSELSLAIRSGMPASELADIPRPFQSWGEAIRLAALQLS